MYSLATDLKTTSLTGPFMLDLLCSLQIAAVEEAMAAATGAAASEAAVASVAETAAAMVVAAAEDTAAAATKWEEGQYLWVQYS